MIKFVRDHNYDAKLMCRFKAIILCLAATALCTAAGATQSTRLDSKPFHNGNTEWKMATIPDVRDGGEAISSAGYDDSGWMEAIVPGTVLNTMVHNKLFPEPYYGLNNSLDDGCIPDITVVGRDFYTAWWRCGFTVPADWNGSRIWLQLDGINYRAEVWVNGHLLSTIGGMFRKERIDITSVARPGETNILAVKTIPVDVPGTRMPKTWGAVGEWHNGGDGDIGLNTTMLMSVGWDFTFMDGIRDRNTGIWKSIKLFRTGDVALKDPFIRCELDKPGYDRAAQTISVTVVNPDIKDVRCKVRAELPEQGVCIEKEVCLFRGEEQQVCFSPEQFSCLILDNPKLWWPVNKGEQPLYTLRISALTEDGKISDSLSTRFGIREIRSDTDTPDGSRVFYVNGKRLFIRGSNWIPEAMLRMSDSRTEAELRYTRQSGINLLRLWGGGIQESDTFYRLCDELGILVWQEFWMTGDTRHPQDKAMYFANVESCIKDIRNHPSLAYYVASNESSEVSGMRELVDRLDGTRGYQMQSECDGIHDGSPYKQVNPMRHYENTASDRGSRVDGFNPEYGSPCLPTVECLREMMDEKDLWPINKKVWDYLDGNGFSEMTTLYKDLTDKYGESQSIEEFARKAQYLGAMNYKSIWEVWNYNKFGYGDRWASGVLFWYHNSAIRHVGSMMWDWSLEPMASLYAAANALEPLHAQFDYLKNSVSVVNDFYRSFNDYTLRAVVYDFDSRIVSDRRVRLDIPEDGVACDVLRLEFPKDISQIHFIKLYIYDEKGAEVSSNFYWRSKDKYEGKNTLTGPCTSGFEYIEKLAHAALKFNCTYSKEGDKTLIRIKLRNDRRRIAYFVRLQLSDKDGKPARPSFYSDNFFCMVPGESREILIETFSETPLKLTVSGTNTSTMQAGIR